MSRDQRRDLSALSDEIRILEDSLLTTQDSRVRELDRARFQQEAKTTRGETLKGWIGMNLIARRGRPCQRYDIGPMLICEIQAMPPRSLPILDVPGCSLSRVPPCPGEERRARHDESAILSRSVLRKRVNPALLSRVFSRSSLAG